MLGALYNQMRSRSPNHQITGLTLLQTHQRGGLTLTKLTIQVDGVASTTPLYFCLGHKEAVIRLIFYQLVAIHYHQMKTTLPYLHIKGGILCQGWKKGEDKDVVRENISEEYP